jgi:hypothetical protein
MLSEPSVDEVVTSPLAASPNQYPNSDKAHLRTDAFCIQVPTVESISCRLSKNLRAMGCRPTVVSPCVDRSRCVQVNQAWCGFLNRVRQTRAVKIVCNSRHQWICSRTVEGNFHHPGNCCSTVLKIMRIPICLLARLHNSLRLRER